MLPELISKCVKFHAIDAGIRGCGQFMHTCFSRDSTQERSCYGSKLGRRKRHANIGVASSDRQARLKVHMQSATIVCATNTRILSREFNRRQPCAQKVRFESHDDARAIETVMRNDRCAEGLRVGLA